MKNHAKTCSHVPTKEWMLTKPIPALSTLPCLWPALATHQLYKKSAAYTTQSLKAAQGLKMRCFGCLGRDEKKTMKSGQTPKLSKIFGRRKIQVYIEKQGSGSWRLLRTASLASPASAAGSAGDPRGRLRLAQVL